MDRRWFGGGLTGSRDEFAPAWTIRVELVGDETTISVCHEVKFSIFLIIF